MKKSFKREVGLGWQARNFLHRGQDGQQRGWGTDAGFAGVSDRRGILTLIASISLIK